MCPYHASRDVLNEGAALIFVTYSQLLDPPVRSANGLNDLLKGAVLVFDEVLSGCILCSSQSFFRMLQLCSCSPLHMPACVMWHAFFVCWSNALCYPSICMKQQCPCCLSFLAIRQLALPGLAARLLYLQALKQHLQQDASLTWPMTQHWQWLPCGGSARPAPQLRLDATGGMTDLMCCVISGPTGCCRLTTLQLSAGQQQLCR